MLTLFKNPFKQDAARTESDRGIRIGFSKITKKKIIIIIHCNIICSFGKTGINVQQFNKSIDEMDRHNKSITYFHINHVSVTIIIEVPFFNSINTH